MQRQMTEEILNSAEGRIRDAIAQKRKESSRLLRDIKQLERQLAALRRAGAEKTDVPRSSSIARLLVEHVVLDRLRANVPPETTSDQLWPLAHAAGVKSRSTFRSQLRRMKERGLIVSLAPARWGLAPDAPRDRRLPPELRKVLEQISRK
jgi:hypothetical protein